MAETLDWGFAPTIEQGSDFGDGASPMSIPMATPSLPVTEETPEDVLDDGSILKDSGWLIDDKTGLSSQNGNPIVHVSGEGADRMKGDYTGFWEKDASGHYNYVGTTSGGVGHFNTNPVGMRDPVQVYSTPTGQALYLDRGVYLGNDQPSSEGIRSQYIDNPKRLEREANYQAWGTVNGKKFYLTDDEIIQGLQGKITKNDLVKRREDYNLLKRWNDEGGNIYPTGDGKLSLLDLLEKGAIDQATWDSIAPRVMDSVNRPMTPEEYLKAENDARLELARTEYVKYEADRPWWEKAFGVLGGINEFLNPGLPTPTGELAQKLNGQELKIAGGETTDILETAKAAITYWDWYERADPEYQQILAKTLGKPNSVATTGKDPLTSLVEATIKDPQMVEVMVRNLREQYDKNASTGVKVGAALVEAALLLLTPVAAGTSSMAISKEARAAFLELNKAKFSQDAINKTLGKAALNPTELLVKQKKLEEVQRLVEKVGGQEIVTRLSQEAVKDSVKASNVIRKIEDQIASLNKENKDIPQKLLQQWDDALGDYKTIQTRLQAIPLVKNPELLMGQLTKAKLNEPTFTFKPLSTPEQIISTESPLRHIKMLETEAGQLRYVYGMHSVQAQSLATAETSALEALPEVIKYSKTTGMVKNFKPIAGAVDDEGHALTNNIHQLMEYSDKYIPITPIKGIKTAADLDEVKIAYRILEERLKMLEEAGIKIDLLKLSPNKHYLPRIVLQEINKAAKGGGFGPKSQELPREFSEIIQGIAAGMRYENDYRKLIHRTVEDAYKMVAEKYFIDGAKKLGTDLIPSAEEVTLGGFKRLATTLKRYGDDILAKKNTSYEFTTKDINRYKALFPSLKDVQTKSADEIVKLIQTESQKINNNISILENARAAEPKFIKIKGINGLEEVKFEAGVARELKETLKPQVSKALKLTGDVGDVTRTLLTNYDAGPALIQGALMFGRGLVNPAEMSRWGQSVYHATRAFWDSKYLAGFAAKNKEWIKTSVTDLHMMFNSSEFALGANIMEKLPGGKIHSAPFGRIMNGFLDSARLSQVKARYNPGMTTQEKVALGDSIDKWLGNVSAQRLGLSYKRQLVEKILFFAPRYYRAYAGLVVDAFKGGKTGRETLKALAEFQLGAHLGFYGFAKAWQAIGGMKEEPNIIPGTPHYMQVKIGNTWVGLGGIALSVNQTISRMAQTVLSDDDLGTKITDFVANDIGGFGRGHASRLAQILINTGLGTNYLGYSTTDGGAGKWITDELLKGSLPISLKETLDTVADGESSQDTATTFAFNFIGLRVSPQSTSGARREMLNTIAAERHGVSADTLYKEHYGDYLALFSDPRMQSLNDKMDAEQIKKGSAWWDEPTKQLVLYTPKRDEVSSTLEKERNYAAMQFQKGLISDTQFREIISQWGKWAGEQYDSLEKQYPLAVAKIREPKNIPNSASQLQAAYITYKDTVLNNIKLNESTDGITYYQTLRSLNNDFVAKYGEQTYSDIQRMLVSSKTTHPVYNSYVIDRNAINQSGYWDLPRGTDERNLAIKSWLTQHPDIEAKLYTWGYLKTVQTEASERLARNELYDLGINKSVPKALDRNYYESAKKQLDTEIDRIKQITGRKGMWAQQSIDVKGMSDTGYDLIANARKYENAAKNAPTITQQDKYLDLMFKEMSKLRDLENLVTNYANSHNEPHLDLLKLNIQSWILENEARYGRQ